MVSRFRTRQEIKEALDRAAEGKLDILVGTHRLLSKDVLFKDLGLLIVDEEQRFGVAHKERIKQMRKKVDVLTLTATPIPRTLNMSLVGIRDMSVIETPPKDRLSIQTNVVKFDSAVIERAIRNELARGGQVYFVHNRVESIFSIGGAPPPVDPRGEDRCRPRPDGRRRARARDAGLRRSHLRRAARHDDRRKRPRHPERQHDHHQSRRSIRAVTALSAARARRPLGPSRLTPIC
jgi:hypothetical protein